MAAAGRVEISLCSSDEEGAPPSVAVKLGKRKGKERAVTPSAKKEKLQEDSDDEVMVVDRPTPQTADPVTIGASSSSGVAAGAGSSSDVAAADDDVEYVGRTGEIALADFPHSRENCCVVKFVPGREKEYCANCYCESPPTRPHGHSPPDPCALMRNVCARRWQATCVTRPPPAAPSGPSTARRRTRRRNGSSVVGSTVRALRMGRQRRCPSRALAPTQPPRGHARRSSRQSSRSTPWRPLRRPDYSPHFGRTRHRALHTCCTSSAPQIRCCSSRFGQTAECARAGFCATRWEWVRCARCHPPVECRFFSQRPLPARAGKTCVCAALILAHAAANKPKKADVTAFEARTLGCRANVWTKVGGVDYLSHGKSTDFAAPDATRTPMMQAFKMVWCKETRRMVRSNRLKEWVRDHSLSALPNPAHKAWKEQTKIRFGLTVVLTSCTLLGQWQDELRKWAPSLRVGVYYGVGRDAMYKELSKLDVVLTTHGSTLFNGFREWTAFHRLIIDECHLLTGSNEGIRAYDARFVWGVSGTPMSSSPTDLRFMAETLGQWTGGLNLKADTFIQTRNGPRVSVEQYGNFQRFVDKLRKIMIRHTKAQRIGGEAALALPDSAAETAMIGMSGAERARYNDVEVWLASRLKTIIGRESKPKTWVVEMEMSGSRQQCAGAAWDAAKRCAKLEWLLADLATLRASDPTMHAVVFTHFAASYSRIRSSLVLAGYTVCGFQGNCQPAERHRTIREFQESVDSVQGGAPVASSTNAKIFLATMKVGNVGITLTAATRVYLFEPCLDPAMEMQAAGRIHRLGQTKDVLVKRLVYRHSIESAILKVHDEIKAGRLRIVDHAWPKEGLRALLHEFERAGQDHDEDVDDESAVDEEEEEDDDDDDMH